VATIMDFGSRPVIRIVGEDLQKIIEKSLAPLKSKDFVLSIYFGQNMAKSHQKLAATLFQEYRAPILRAKFTLTKKWSLVSILPLPISMVPETHKEFLYQAAQEYFSKRVYRSKKEEDYAYDLAILVGQEATPPSDARALKRFEEAALQSGLYPSIIDKADLPRIAEYDALFIRETTSVRDHTYQFSRSAHKNGLVVMDDPISILRCTNKVYLNELLRKRKLPQPRAEILGFSDKSNPPATLGFPLVLKKPDSSFSLGVIKVKDPSEYRHAMGEMLQDSELVLG
jgi:hypothetical protein